MQYNRKLYLISTDNYKFMTIISELFNQMNKSILLFWKLADVK